MPSLSMSRGTGIALPAAITFTAAILLAVSLRKKGARVKGDRDCDQYDGDPLSSNAIAVVDGVRPELKASEPTSEHTLIERQIITQPTHAKNVLYRPNCELQPCSSNILDLEQVVSTHTERIVEDTEKDNLSAFVKKITFCDFVKDYLRLNSGKDFVKQFQVVHLLTEHLSDTQHMMSTNLNDLAEGGRDPVEDLGEAGWKIATPCHELYSHHEVEMKLVHLDSMVESEGVLTHVDPKLYSLQERRMGVPSSYLPPNETPITWTCQDGIIHLHILFSTHAVHLKMDVKGSLTIRNMMNCLAEQFLGTGRPGFHVSESPFHKDLSCKNQAQAIQQHSSATDDALVLMPPQVEEACDNATSEVLQSKLMDVAGEVHSICVGTEIKDLTSLEASVRDGSKKLENDVGKDQACSLKVDTIARYFEWETSDVSSPPIESKISHDSNEDAPGKMEMSFNPSSRVKGVISCTHLALSDRAGRKGGLSDLKVSLDKCLNEGGMKEKKALTHLWSIAAVVALMIGFLTTNSLQIGVTSPLHLKIVGNSESWIVIDKSEQKHLDTDTKGHQRSVNSSRNRRTLYGDFWKTVGEDINQI